MTRTARFITVEGLEGAGKTTVLNAIEAQLRASGVDLITTREPGGTSLGEDIRELLLGHKHDGMADDTELLLMFAARAEHLHKVIRPALDRGQWVLCDRFTDATYAYQGGGRGIDMARIETLERFVQGTLRPDHTFLLDLPVKQGLDRAAGRSEPDRFEKQREAFFDAARATYRARAQAEPGRFRIIDASRDLNGVLAQLQASVSALLDEELGA
ncbi:MAG: dTMP kinase [Gammaproteobacteria bacterium]|nr:dTMP kinase [Gammaproteobacteria bacterium]MCP5137170.1 dTMP kinase [Gammaproteobacteria bacterium]